METIEHRDREDREPADVGIEPGEHAPGTPGVAQRERRRQWRVRAGDLAVVVGEGFVVGVVERIGRPETEVDAHHLAAIQLDHRLEHVTPQPPVRRPISEMILETRRRYATEPAADAAPRGQLERGRREQEQAREARAQLAIGLLHAPTAPGPEAWIDRRRLDSQPIEAARSLEHEAAVVTRQRRQ
jgi:hypothetical protein